MSEHDRQETEEDLQLASRVLHRYRRRFEAIPKAVDRPVAGSVLDEERRHTARDPSHVLVATHRSRSIENLERLFQIVFDDERGLVVGYPYSPYALIRASIESAATALWIIESDRKTERVRRALQLSFRDTQDRLRFITLIGTATDVADEQEHAQEAIARITELKNTVGALRQSAIGNPPKYTEILKRVSQKERESPNGPYEISSPLVVWKIASAFIHGSEDLIRALSDIRQTEEFIDGVGHFEITPSFRVLAGCIIACVSLLERTDERYTLLSTRDYAGRIPSA